MSKSRLADINQFQAKIDAELSWRRKELTAIKFLIEKDGQKLYQRSAIVMSYAHWEGFVKASAEHLLEHVHSQRLGYNSILECYVTDAFMAESEKHLNLKHNARMEFFRKLNIYQSSDRARFSQKLRLIDTKSNLSSEVFENICVRIGISTASYEPKYKLMDEVLLKKRNEIAHGADIVVTREESLQVVESVQSLIGQFSTDVGNFAAQRSYKKPLGLGLGQDGRQLIVENGESILP